MCVEKCYLSLKGISLTAKVLGFEWEKGEAVSVFINVTPSLTVPEVLFYSQDNGRKV